MRRLPFVVLVIFGLLGLVPVAASAAPLTCPTTLMHDTTLHADLDCSGVTSGYAVTFGKPGITLDLNGHTISGPSGPDSGIGIYTAFNNDTIKDGKITNFGSYQIYSYGAMHTVVQSVHMVGDPADSNSIGMYTEYGGTSAIAHNVATGFTGDAGFYFYGSGGNVVANNTATSNYYGVYSEYESNDRFVGNHFSSNTYGFYDDYGDKVTYRGNTANSNTSEGFYLDCDTYGVPRVLNNTANHNGGDGLYTYECFYDYGSTTAYAIIKGNSFNQNGDDGINDDYPLQNVIVGNTTNGNQSDSGIYIEDNYSLYNVRMVANNVANNNSSYGIYADYFVPPERTSNNSAGGNSVQNCFNISCS